MALPLVILAALSILSAAGLGGTVVGHANFSNLAEDTVNVDVGYFDSSGRMICYANYTKVAGLEDGSVNVRGTLLYGVVEVYWANATSYYRLHFEDPEGEPNFWFSANGITVVGVLLVVIGMAVLASFHILSSGLSETGVSAVVKGSFFGFVFALVAFSGGGLLNQIPFVGSFIYLGLTLVYLVGVVDMFGHPSGA